MLTINTYLFMSEAFVCVLVVTENWPSAILALTSVTLLPQSTTHKIINNVVNFVV